MDKEIAQLIAYHQADLRRIKSKVTGQLQHDLIAAAESKIKKLESINRKIEKSYSSMQSESQTAEATAAQHKANQCPSCAGIGQLKHPDTGQIGKRDHRRWCDCAAGKRAYAIYAEVLGLPTKAVAA